jgi:hypothetical protein
VVAEEGVVVAQQGVVDAAAAGRPEGHQGLVLSDHLAGGGDRKGEGTEWEVTEWGRGQKGGGDRKGEGTERGRGQRVEVKRGIWFFQLDDLKQLVTTRF